MTSVQLFLKSPVPSSGRSWWSTGWRERSLLKTRQAGPGRGGQWYNVLLGTRPKWNPEPVPGPVLFIAFVKDMGGAASERFWWLRVGWEGRGSCFQGPSRCWEPCEVQHRGARFCSQGGRGQLHSKAWRLLGTAQAAARLQEEDPQESRQELVCSALHREAAAVLSPVLGPWHERHIAMLKGRPQWCQWEHSFSHSTRRAESDPCEWSPDGAHFPASSHRYHHG